MPKARDWIMAVIVIIVLFFVYGLVQKNDGPETEQATCKPLQIGKGRVELVVTDGKMRRFCTRV